MRIAPHGGRAADRIERWYRREARCLTDPTRKSARGRYRTAYTEAQFERRLSDERSLPLLDEVLTGPALLADRLRDDEMTELLRSLDLPDRLRLVCRRRVEGCSLPEIAGELGISERRAWSLMAVLRETLRDRLAQRPLPPSHGWRDVFLSSQRRE